MDAEYQRAANDQDFNSEIVTCPCGLSRGLTSSLFRTGWFPENKVRHLPPVIFQDSEMGMEGSLFEFMQSVSKKHTMSKQLSLSIG